MSVLDTLRNGIPLNPMPPAQLERDPSVPHAPAFQVKLNSTDFALALRNALRYFPVEHHAVLAPEFANELREYGHIFMYRFRPSHYEMKAHPLSLYPATTQQAACIMLMIQNNLDYAVAQFPHELITYGGNGSVFSNWAQYHIVMQYLAEMTETQTLHMYSGHPHGLFPSHTNAPRVVITNGMVIPNYSSNENLQKMFATGVSMYGQMTAGSYCYIGPQGIVHGTTITVLNAGRKYLGLGGVEDMAGRVFVTAGLGGKATTSIGLCWVSEVIGCIAGIVGIGCRNLLGVLRVHATLLAGFGCLSFVSLLTPPPPLPSVILLPTHRHVWGTSQSSRRCRVHWCGCRSR